MEFRKYNLQKLVLIPLSLTFLALISAFVITSYHISQRDEAAFMGHSFKVLLEDAVFSN